MKMQLAATRKLHQIRSWLDSSSLREKLSKKGYIKISGKLTSTIQDHDDQLPHLVVKANSRTALTIFSRRGRKRLEFWASLNIGVFRISYDEMGQVDFSAILQIFGTLDLLNRHSKGCVTVQIGDDYAPQIVYTTPLSFWDLFTAANFGDVIAQMQEETDTFATLVKNWNDDFKDQLSVVKEGVFDEFDDEDVDDTDSDLDDKG